MNACGRLVVCLLCLYASDAVYAIGASDTLLVNYSLNVQHTTGTYKVKNAIGIPFSESRQIKAGPNNNEFVLSFVSLDGTDGVVRIELFETASDATLAMPFFSTEVRYTLSTPTEMVIERHDLNVDLAFSIGRR